MELYANIKQYSTVQGKIQATLCSTNLLNTKNYNTCFLTVCFYRLQYGVRIKSNHQHCQYFNNHELLSNESL